jgi:hypothetical protein
MSGKSGRDKEAWHLFDRRDDRNGVGRDIDQARPLVLNVNFGEGGKNPFEARKSSIRVARDRLRVERPYRLIRGGAIERGQSGLLPLVKEATSEPEPKGSPFEPQHREKILEEFEAVWNQISARLVGRGDQIAAIHALAIRKFRSPCASARTAFQGRSPQD